MNDPKIARITGVFGVACVALTFGQFPLWLVGSPPSVYVALSAVAYHGWFRLCSIATIPILAGFGAASSVAIQGIRQNSTLWAGGFERINVYTYFAWLIVLGVTVARRSLDHRRRHVRSGTVTYDGLYVFAINAAQLEIFRRYDFMSMYCVRFVYYMIWHVAWGHARLNLLF